MDRPPLTYVFSPFSGDERAVLQRFVDTVEALKTSTFSATKPSMNLTQIPGATYLGGPAWSTKMQTAQDPAVKEIVGDFRLLYTDRNRTSAMSVLKMLQRHARERQTDSSREMIGEIKALRRRLARRKKEHPVGKVLEEESFGISIERSPDSIVKTWLNGKYLHDDPDHAVEIEPEGDTPVEMFRWSFHTTVRDFITLWGSLASLVEQVFREPALRD